MAAAAAPGKKKKKKGEEDVQEVDLNDFWLRQELKMSQCPSVRYKVFCLDLSLSGLSQVCIRSL